MNRHEKIAVRVASNKDKSMIDLIEGARKIRAEINNLYKDFLKLGRKVKYIEPVGPLVAEAINEIIEAEMAIKAVIDAGTAWNDTRAMTARFDPYGEEGRLDPAYVTLDELQKRIGWMVSNIEGWWYKNRGGSVLFHVSKPSYAPPERGVLMELSVRIDDSMLERRGTIVVTPEWEVSDTIELDDWTKAARAVNQSPKMSLVVKGAFDAFERKEQVQVPKWIRKHMHNYVMKNAWENALRGRGMRSWRYDIGLED